MAAAHMILGIDGTDRHLIPDQPLFQVGQVVAEYTSILQEARAGVLDFVVFRDQRAPGRNGRVAGLDALSLAARLAPTVPQIGLVVAKSVSFTEPFTVSRELATLDFVSGGRAGWQVLSIADARTAQNYGLPIAPDAATRSAQAAEYVSVSRKLWDSWEDNAVVMDRERGWYIDPNKLHHINHRGAQYAIRGPSITYRPPQGHLVVVVDDDHTHNIETLIPESDVVITHSPTLVAAQQTYARIHAQATAAQREIRVLQRVLPIIAQTTQQAFSRARALEQAANERGWTLPDAQLMAGTAAQVADQLGLWWNAQTSDGFVLVLPELAADIEVLTTLLVPELQRRGYAKSAYTGNSLRSHLGLTRPANQYAGAPTEAFLDYEQGA